MHWNRVSLLAVARAAGFLAVMCTACHSQGRRSTPSASRPAGAGTPGVRSATAPTSPYAKVDITDLNGWYLTIRADGSGLLGYGSTAGDSQKFPARTFDFNQVV